MNPNKLPRKLLSLKEPLKQFHNICKTQHYDISKVLLDFVIKNKFIDNVVIGVDSVNQLNQNIEKLNHIQISNTVYKEIERIKIKQEHLLNPSNW